MNKYLEQFIEDELKNNSYYETIREFAVGKDFDDDVLGPILGAYDDNLDVFAPYKFLDAIEDYLQDAKESKPAIWGAADMWEVIDAMWDCDAFENY